MRITNDALIGMLARLQRDAQALGIDTTGWTLHHGSRSAGVSYRLVGRAGESIFAPNGFLGMTAREAHDTLYHYACAFERLAYDKPTT